MSDKKPKKTIEEVKHELDKTLKEKDLKVKSNSSRVENTKTEAIKH